MNERNLGHVIHSDVIARETTHFIAGLLGDQQVYLLHLVFLCMLIYLVYLCDYKYLSVLMLLSKLMNVSILS